MSAECAATVAVRAPVRVRALHGVLWTLGGYGAAQALRFASNLVLTRLLMPEAFGLMILTMVFITGLELLSDVGVGPAIVRSKRGDDLRLLDTAWTVQIIRGFVLFVLALLLAVPVGRFYHQPQLPALLAVAGVGALIRGFTPARVHTLNREVVLGQLTVLDLLCQVISVAGTIVAAWMWRSVWALIVGALVADGARVVLSYLLLPGRRHRFRLDRGALTEIVHVGRWVFLSTLLTYLVGHVDRMLMGRVLSARELGVYGVALFIVLAVQGVGRTVGSRVAFPVLAETERLSPELLRTRLRRVRTLWVLPTSAVLLGLAIWGEVLVRLFYGPEFHDAGWMLRVLAMGSIAAVVNQASGVIWPAIGEFRIVFFLMLLQLPVLFAAMLVGNSVYGLRGFVIGTATVELILLPVQAAFLARRKLWQPSLDLSVLFVSAAIVLAC